MRDASLRRHTFLKKSVSKNLPAKRKQIRHFIFANRIDLNQNISSIVFRVYSKSFIINSFNCICNTIAVRLRSKSSRFYRLIRLHHQIICGEAFCQAFSRKSGNRISRASPTNQNLKLITDVRDGAC